jgi:hypothetical protein
MGYYKIWQNFRLSSFLRILHLNSFKFWTVIKVFSLFCSDHFGGGYVEQMASPVSQQQWSPFAKQQPSPHQHMDMSPMLSSTTPTDELTSMSPLSQQQGQQQQQQPTSSYNQKTSERMKQDEGLWKKIVKA